MKLNFLSTLTIIFSMCAFCAPLSIAANGKLKGTAGVSAIEGSAGGGLIPWATIGSYATREEIGGSVFNSEARIDDYNLSVHGIGVSFYDRLELGYAHQDFYSDALARSIRQNIVSLKVRVVGDLVYDDLPLISLGVQHKRLLDEDVLGLVGAKDDSGTDLYVSAAKAWIDGPFSRTTFINANLRFSDANELGLLGYGGDDSKSKWLFETAAGSFITKNLAIGVEFRQKRNHLAALDEDDWLDLFVAWFPNKTLSLTAAYLDLGEIVGQEDQTGFYVSMQGTF